MRKTSVSDDGRDRVLRSRISTLDKFSHKDLARKLAALEGKYDRQFKVVFDAIRSLMAQPELKHRGIGFTAKIDV